MPDNIWKILENAGVPMKSFILNTGPEQYSWTLPNLEEEVTTEEVARAVQRPRPRMPVK